MTITDIDHRTISGLALPWGVEGATSGGALVVNPGALTIPDDPTRIKVYRDHSNDGGVPVGYVAALDSKDDGLYVTVTLSNTPEGDAAYTDVVEKIRDAFSVEIHDGATDENHQLITGTLTAIALVPIPAYSDARVHTFTASLKGPSLMADTTVKTDTTEDTKTDTTVKTDTTEDTARAAEPATSPKLPTLTVASRSDKDKTITAARVAHAIAAVRSGATPDDMITAALSDITRGGQPSISAPAWLGELWSGNAYQREIVPTLTHKDLTKMTATAWRWKTKPTVGEYAGDKAEIPTNAPKTEAVTITAKRLAGGHDIDRAFFDFNDTEFLTSYFQAMSESYAMLSDDKAAEFVTTAAKANKGKKAGDMFTAAATAAHHIKKALRVSPTTFLIHPDDQLALLALTEKEKPAYLSLLGIDPGKFLASEHALKGHVIAYAKPALEFYELAGSPIRIEAEHIAHGGRDAALFGYYATNVTNAKGVAAVEFGGDAS